MNHLNTFLFATCALLFLGCSQSSSTGTSTPSTWTGIKQFGVATKVANPFGICIDSSGNVYTSGWTTGGLDGNTLNGTIDLFVSKYNSAGTKQWTKQTGAASVTVFGNRCAVDSSGNVYVAGYVNGGSVDGQTQVGTQDFLLVKYNSSGTKQWTRQLGVASVETRGYGVAVDSTGSNAYITGLTYGGLDGNSLVGSSYDMFVTKYDSSGTKIFTKQLGVSGAATMGQDVGVDSSGYFYVTGSTGGNLDSQTKTGTGDSFLTKYNSSGTIQWTRLLGVASASTFGSAIKVTSSYVYVHGSTTGGLDGNTLVSSPDIFVTQYTQSGTKNWTQQSAAGNTAAVFTDSTENVYMIGSSYTAVDSIALTGTQDLCLTKYSSTGVRDWTKMLGVASVSTFGKGVAVDSNDGIYVAGTTLGGLGGNTLTGSQDGFIAKYNTSGSIQ